MGATMQRGLLLLLAVLATTGCARMVVKKDPGPHDKGIRYYRPKPYLFIGPGAPLDAPKEEKSVTKPASFQEEGDQPKVVPVVMRIEYLPDYKEEYSIRVTPGFGQAKLNVSLQNGWNLSSVGIETDQKYAEIIGSIAQLASAVGSTLRDGSAGSAESNVPLGYYESVIACNERGQKEMLGWRYVGFFPCNAAPVTGRIVRDEVAPDDDHLFALVFEGGTLKMISMRSEKEKLECPCETFGPTFMPPVESIKTPPSDSRTPTGS